jgi:cytochrome c biogenesis protein CcmG/thiol:disulfide interchange protein DsbE
VITERSPQSPQSPEAATTRAIPRTGFALRRGLQVLGIGTAVLFVVLLAYGVVAQSPSTRIDDNLARGRAVAAPAFELAVLQDGSLGPTLGARLAGVLSHGQLGPRQVRGVPFVLNFWASWCDPCRQEAPLLERTWRDQARPRGVLFLGLDMQDVTSDGVRFLRTFGTDYPSVRDPTNDVARSYGATGVPETFFIDRRGEVVAHVIGVATAAQLRDGIGAAIDGEVLAARRGGAERPSR